MMERWMRVVKDKRFTTGATIPYILAALRDPIGAVASADTSKEELRALLVEMRDDVPPPECVVILWCSRIEALVVSSRPTPPAGRRRIQSPYDPDRGLYFREIDGYQVTDLDSLTQALWDLHKDVILEGCFNRENRQWHHIDDGERREIESTLHDDE